MQNRATRSGRVRLSRGRERAGPVGCRGLTAAAGVFPSQGVRVGGRQPHHSQRDPGRRGALHVHRDEPVRRGQGHRRPGRERYLGARACARRARGMSARAASRVTASHVRHARGVTPASRVMVSHVRHARGVGPASRRHTCAPAARAASHCAPGPPGVAPHSAMVSAAVGASNAGGGRPGRTGSGAYSIRVGRTARAGVWGSVDAP